MEDRINELESAVGQIATMLQNLKLRIEALEGRLGAATEDVSVADIHTEMEVTGDSYAECEERIRRRRLTDE